MCSERGVSGACGVYRGMCARSMLRDSVESGLHREATIESDLHRELLPTRVCSECPNSVTAR